MMPVFYLASCDDWTTMEVNLFHWQIETTLEMGLGDALPTPPFHPDRKYTRNMCLFVDESVRI